MGLFGVSEEHVSSKIPFPMLERVNNVSIDEVKVERASFGTLQLVFQLTCVHDGTLRTMIDYRELPERGKMEIPDGKTEKEVLYRKAKSINNAIRQYGLATGLNDTIRDQVGDCNDAEEYGKIVAGVFNSAIDAGTLPQIRVKTYYSQSGYPKVGRAGEFAESMQIDESKSRLEWSDWEQEQNALNNPQNKTETVNGVQDVDIDLDTEEQEELTNSGGLVEFLDD